MNLTVNALLPTPPEPSTTILKSVGAIQLNIPNDGCLQLAEQRMRTVVVGHYCILLQSFLKSPVSLRERY